MWLDARKPLSDLYKAVTILDELILITHDVRSIVGDHSMLHVNVQWDRKSKLSWCVDARPS